MAEDIPRTNAESGCYAANRNIFPPHLPVLDTVMTRHDNATTLLPASLLEWLARTRAGDLSSLAGLAVSIIGFAITIYTAYRSKSAAQAAETAARETRARLAAFDSMVAISTAIAGLDEVRRLHRQSAWAILPDRYSALRKALISIRNAAGDLSEAHAASLQAAIQQLANLEQQMDQVIANPSKAPDFVKLNQVVSKHADRLTEVLEAIRARK